jgi:hypothetical protein
MPKREIEDGRLGQESFLKALAEANLPRTRILLATNHRVLPDIRESPR